MAAQHYLMSLRCSKLPFSLYGITALIKARSIFYQSCLIHLLRRFIKVHRLQPAKSPQTVCTEAAIALSNLLALYNTTYGSQYPFLVMTHAAMTAAIQHLLDMSSTMPAVAAQASLYLRDAIQALHQMRKCISLSTRYVKALGHLVNTLAPNPPDHIAFALAEAGLDNRDAPPVTNHAKNLALGIPFGGYQIQTNSFQPEDPTGIQLPPLPSLPSMLEPNTANPAADGSGHDIDITTSLASSLDRELFQLIEDMDVPAGQADGDADVKWWAVDWQGH
jgi:hypothetical protein